MPPRRRRQNSVDGPTLEAVMGAVLALAPAYFLAEGILRVYPHLTHWVGTGLGIAGGYGLGALVAAYKEERPPFGRDLSRSGRVAPTGHRASVAGQGTRVRARPGGRGDQSETAERRTGR